MGRCVRYAGVFLRQRTHLRTHSLQVVHLILVAFITGNSSLEPLIEGLYAQIHVNHMCIFIHLCICVHMYMDAYVRL